MVKRIAAAAIMALGVCASSHAMAQGVSLDVVNATAGEWLIAEQNGKPGCRFMLLAQTAIGGYGLSVPANCAARLPKIAQAAAWRFDGKGGLALADAARKTIVTFAEEQEGSFYRGSGDADRDLIMTKAPIGVDALPMAGRLFGAWILRRPGGSPLCTVTLLDRPPPGGEESFALRLSSNCDAALTRLKLASWRVETTDLLLYGTDGASLAMTPNAAGGFSKAAREGGRPLEMIRAQR